MNKNLYYENLLFANWARKGIQAQRTNLTIIGTAKIIGTWKVKDVEITY